jgi:hypothetical protein
VTDEVVVGGEWRCGDVEDLLNGSRRGEGDEMGNSISHGGQPPFSQLQPCIEKVGGTSSFSSAISNFNGFVVQHSLGDLGLHFQMHFRSLM